MGNCMDKWYHDVKLSSIKAVPMEVYIKRTGQCPSIDLPLPTLGANDFLKISV